MSTPPPGGVQQGYPNPYGHQGGASTPPPYNLSPAPSGGGGRRNTGVIVGSAVAAIIAVSTVIIAIALSGGGDDNGGNQANRSPAPVRSEQQPAGTGGGDTNGQNAEDVTNEGGNEGGEATEDDGEDGDGGFKGEDTSKTIDASECTEAHDSFLEKGNKSMPDLTFKHLNSVKDCIREAGWKLDEVEYEDENLYGKNTVLSQSPRPYQAFDPKEDEITLTVSTGEPSS